MKSHFAKLPKTCVHRQAQSRRGVGGEVTLSSLVGVGRGNKKLFFKILFQTHSVYKSAVHPNPQDYLQKPQKSLALPF